MFKSTKLVLHKMLIIASVACPLLVGTLETNFSWMSVSVAAESLHDPTQPPGVIASNGVRSVLKKKALWRLSSTLIAKQRKIATINGRLIRPGERINGAVLIDIQRWNVTLQRNHKKFKVYMFNEMPSKKLIN